MQLDLFGTGSNQGAAPRAWIEQKKILMADQLAARPIRLQSRVEVPARARMQRLTHVFAHKNEHSRLAARPDRQQTVARAAARGRQRRSRLHACHAHLGACCFIVQHRTKPGGAGVALGPSVELLLRGRGRRMFLEHTYLKKQQHQAPLISQAAGTWGCY